MQDQLEVSQQQVAALAARLEDSEAQRTALAGEATHMRSELVAEHAKCAAAKSAAGASAAAASFPIPVAPSQVPADDCLACPLNAASFGAAAADWTSCR